jgi:hypothetical protein
MDLETTKKFITELNHAEKTVEELAELIQPLLSPVDFQGLSLIIKVPTDNLPADGINRLYAYADWLRHLGAKNVVFLPRGAEVETIQFSKEQHYSLKLGGGALDKVDEILDWLRIAGADPDRVVVLGPDCELKGKH